MVLVIMHQVSFQGVNLDQACNSVFVANNVVNASQEWQSWGRMMKILQHSHFPNQYQIEFIL